MRTLVVLPTYQEAENIADVLATVRKAEPDADILVIDDGSPDGTADLAAEIAVEMGQIEVLRRKRKSGLGSAYRAGFRIGLERDYDALVEMDADLSHDPMAMPDLIDALEHAELALGSRYVPGGSVPGWPLERRILSRAGNRYADRMLKLGLADATSGYRAYRAEALRALPLDEIAADGYAFQIEMAYRILRAGGRVVELPITFTDRTHGSSKMSLRIVAEAVWLVTRWGILDRVRGRRSSPDLVLPSETRSAAADQRGRSRIPIEGARR